MSYNTHIHVLYYLDFRVVCVNSLNISKPICQHFKFWPKRVSCIATLLIDEKLNTDTDRAALEKCQFWNFQVVLQFQITTKSQITMYTATTK